MVNSDPPIIENSFRFSVAPMLDYTDKHFRVLMRQISSRALLHTEMIVAQAIHHSKTKDLLLEFNEIEHPISLQIGGDNPSLLAEAALIAENYGYDEINLNVGCPSKRVQSGNFGACLMKEPTKVAKCVEAMVNASSLPVTVKNRIGIDNFESDAFLRNFVDEVSNAGAKRFAIHARKAWLKGLNPKQNREIPELRHDKVISLKKDRPNLTIELNGGLQTTEDCLKALEEIDGTMVGRAAYKNPLLWQSVDEEIFGQSKRKLKASQVLTQMMPYIQDHLSKGGKVWDVAKHFPNLVQNVSGAKIWRNKLTSRSCKRNADLEVIEKAIDELKENDL